MWGLKGALDPADAHTLDSCDVWQRGIEIASGSRAWKPGRAQKALTQLQAQL